MDPHLCWDPCPNRACALRRVCRLPGNVTRNAPARLPGTIGWEKVTATLREHRPSPAKSGMARGQPRQAHSWLLPHLHAGRPERIWLLSLNIKVETNFPISRFLSVS